MLKSHQSAHLAANSIIKIQSLYGKLAKGDQKLKETKCLQAIFSLGLTGAGKSTLTQLITQAKLIITKVKGKIVIENQNPNETNVKIGQTHRSCTDIPNHVKFTYDGVQHNIFDCPGFLDTNTFDSVISNAYYVYQLFYNIKKIKFLLVVQYSSISGHKGKNFLKSVLCFLNLFMFDKQFTIQDLSRKTLFVVTKCTTDLQSVIDQLQSFTNQQINDDQQADQDSQNDESKKIERIKIKQFLKYFKSQDNIQIEQLAKENHALPKTQVLKKLKNKEFFEREYIQGSLDMKNINFRIGQNQLEGKEIELAKTAFDKCSQNIEQFVSRILEALQQISQKLREPTQKYEFWKGWKSLVQKYKLFEGKQWKFQVQSSKKYLNKLNHIKEIYSMIQNYSNQKFVNSTSNIQKEIILLMEKFAIYTKMKSQQLQTLKRFTFILNRKFQEIKVLEQLKSQFTRNNRQSLDVLKGFMISPYEDIQQNYVADIQILENQNIDYYSEIIQLLDKYETVIQGINQKKSDALKKKAALVQNQDNILEAIKYLLQSRNLSENAYSSYNTQYYLKLDVALNKNIADLLFTAKLYKYALCFYRVIDNTQKILECFKFIKNSTKQNRILYAIILQQGDYLRSILRFQKAIQAYKMAYDLMSQNHQYKKQANKRIIQIIQNPQKFTEIYIKRDQRNQFYYRLNSDYNEQQLLKQVEKQCNTEQIQEANLYISLNIPTRK